MPIFSCKDPKGVVRSSNLPNFEKTSRIKVLYQKEYKKFFGKFPKNQNRNSQKNDSKRFPQRFFAEFLDFLPN